MANAPRLLQQQLGHMWHKRIQLRLPPLGRMVVSERHNHSHSHWRFLCWHLCALWA